MLMLHLAVCAGLSLLSFADTTIPPAAIGPRRSDEAQFLVDEAREAQASGDLDLAARSLDRLISRYPGAQSYLRAHLDLGHVQILRGKPALAITPLKTYLQAMSRDPSAHEARIKLAEAYFELGQQDNMLAISGELLNEQLVPKPTAEERLRGLLIKSQAHSSQGETRPARRALDAFMTESQNAVSPALSAHWAFAEVHLQSQLCARILPKTMRPSEAQAKLGTRERASCFLKLLDPVLAALKDVQTPPGYWLRKSSERIESNWKSLDALCQTPPTPPGQRTTEELAKYRLELAPILAKECESTRMSALGRLREAQASTHPSAEFVRTRLIGFLEGPHGNTP